LVAEGKIGGATEEETVTKIDLGRIGAALSPDESGAYLDLAAELEELGYTTLSTGGQIETLDPFKELVRATEHVRVAGSIISVDRFDADQVAALYRDLESTAPGRFVVGLGGAHGPQPLATLHAYLDRLDAAQVPVTDRIMAALGPRMLDLARERASGALPVLVTPAYAAQARDRLGRDRTLAVEQFAVLETDPQRARTIARGPLGFMGQVLAYQASFRRMDFTQEEIDQRADRMVDALVAWGDPESIAARITEQFEAGADHVLISLITDTADAHSVEPWRQLAEHLSY
jgi:probable F420-dependent oxidoreductase